MARNNRKKNERQLSPAARAAADGQRREHNARIQSAIKFLNEGITLVDPNRIFREVIEQPKGPMGIDDWLAWVEKNGAHHDDPVINYMVFMFTFWRMPAISKLEGAAFMENLKLFCTYEGKRYRVTGASRMGDVWLTTNFDRKHGYDLRVDMDMEKLTDWNSVPTQMSARPSKPRVTKFEVGNGPLTQPLTDPPLAPAEITTQDEVEKDL